jgi:hypothetical protein
MGRYSLGGGAGGAVNATTVTITDNESTNEDNAIIFTAGGDVDGGDLGLESDGTLTYNPSTGKVTATGFIGALTGTADTATVATTVTITDNESTNETNAIVFTAGGDVDGGNLGLESDGNLTYNPSTGTIAATELSLAGSAHLDSSPADETVSGITATFTAGETLVRGEVVYFKASDSKMWKAVATATGTMPVVAMAAADISADATGVFLLQGFLQDNGTFPAYTVGGTLYAPEAETSSQNVPEQTAPDSDGDFVQVLGFAVTANSVYFNPSNDVIEHA